MPYFLVYQNGLANVLEAHGRRLLQDSYLACEFFCRGLVAAGREVQVKHYDWPVDLAKVPVERFQDGPGEKYGDQKSPRLA